MAKNYKDIRLFKSDFLESLSHVHPRTPLLFWAPIIGYLIYDALMVREIQAFNAFAFFLLGLIVWTFSEYILHRFAFHFPAKSRISKRLVFLFHGLHHDEPNDPTRLLMPIFPAVLFVSGFYFLFSIIIAEQFLHIFMAAFLIGYLCYDYIHYATHHFPMKSKIGKYLKKHHISHHNKTHDAKYGVSSPLWDYIFGTYHSKQ